MHRLSVAAMSCAGLADATRRSGPRGRGPRGHLPSPWPRSRTHRKGAWDWSAGQRAHRIPSGQHDRLVLQGNQQFRWQLVTARGDLEHVLVEPVVVHRPEALVSLLVAPAVLDTPLARAPVDDIDASE